MSKAAIAAVIVGTIVIVVGVTVGWIVIPNMIETQIGETVELKNDTDQFERFKKLPLPIEFKVYIFEIGNKDEAQAGKKPKMIEKGPYIYKQTREKKQITFPDDDRISYYEYMNFAFDQKASGKNKETDPITILNPALNGVIQILEMKNLDSVLAYLNNPLILKTVFDVEDIYLSTTVREFLFNGYKICENSKIDTLKPDHIPEYVQSTLLCSVLSLMPARNIKVMKDHLVFTFLNHKQTNHDGHYTINNGIKFKYLLGEIEKWEDKSTLDFWKGATSTCNQVKGRDAVIFPPFIEKKTILTVFNTDICRTVDLHFNKEVTVRDTNAYEFILTEDTLSAPSKEFGNECYCLNVTKAEGMNQLENGCIKKGALELFSCYNAHIVLSFPHFLWADDVYKNSVENMKPSEEKHRTFVHLEPNTGTPLAGSKRVQFNMFVKKVEGISYLENYDTPVLMPIIWLDEHVDINDDLFGVLYDSYLSKLTMIEGIRWGIVAAGIFIVVVTIIITVWKNKRAKQSV